MFQMFVAEVFNVATLAGTCKGGPRGLSGPMCAAREADMVGPHLHARINRHGAHDCIRSWGNHICTISNPKKNATTCCVLIKVIHI